MSAEAIEATLASALERSEGYARARVLLGLARYRIAGKCNSGLEFYEQLIKEHPDAAGYLRDRAGYRLFDKRDGLIEDLKCRLKETSGSPKSPHPQGSVQ